MRIDPDHCTDPVLLAAEVRRLRAVIAAGGDCPEADKAADRDNSDKCDATPPANAFEARDLDHDWREYLRRRPAVAFFSGVGFSHPTPNTHPTPDECSVPPEWTSRPYWVDPPSGHRYGFPRLYDPATDGDMRAWMIANGYPKKLAKLGLPCTFTAQTEGVG